MMRAESAPLAPRVSVAPSTPASRRTSLPPAAPVLVPPAPQVPTFVDVIEEVEVEEIVAPPPPPPPSQRRRTDHLRATVVSPDEVIAYIRDSSPPPPMASAPRVTMSDPLDVVFGMVHELAFVEDSLDATAFAARCIAAFLPSKAALIHLYDRSKREYALAYVRGDSAAQALIGHRIPESDALVQMVADEKRTKLVVEAPEAPGVLRERHTLAGGSSQVLVHPVHQAGEMLALVELVDLFVEFEDREAAALSYLTSRLIEFLSTHERILPIPAPAESGMICYHCIDGVQHDCRARKL